MSAESAEWLLYAITAVGAIVWLAGLQFVTRSFPGVVKDEDIESRLDLQEQPPANWICGSVDVKGEPAALMATAVSALAGGRVAGVGPVKILQSGDDRIVFEGALGDPRTRQSPGRIGHAQIRFTPLLPGQTNIRYVLEVTGMRWMLWLAVALQGLGLLALLAGFLLLRLFVVPAAEPAIRVQTVQMVQTVHFLWPPFLFAGLYRYGRRTLRNGLDVFLHNLPYQDPL